MAFVVSSHGLRIERQKVFVSVENRCMHLGLRPVLHHTHRIRREYTMEIICRIRTRLSHKRIRFLLSHTLFVQQGLFYA